MATHTVNEESSGRLFHGLLVWARRNQVERKLAIIFVVCGVIAGSATFLQMTGNLSTQGRPQSVLLLLIVDLIFMLGLSALIARRLVLLWLQRRRGLAGARLHGRLVALFSLVAMVPTILVAVYSVLLFDYGLRAWFSERVSTAVYNSLAVAEAYAEENLKTTANDALAIAQVINRYGAALVYNPLRLGQVLSQQSGARSLTEAAVYTDSGQLLGRATNFLLAFNPDIPDWAFKDARDGKVAIIASESGERVRALVRLDLPNISYLYVGRLVDARVIGHMDRTRGAVQLYNELEGKRYGVEITFALMFAVVALLLLLAAIWVGLGIADHLTSPIGGLIEAAERVASGDLSARVKVGGGGDEIDGLTQAFNRMTGELQTQQGELIEANHMLDDRNQFIEAVLRGVSAGVMGLDSKGRITLVNRAACELLDQSSDSLRDRSLDQLLDGVDGMITAAAGVPGRFAERNVTHRRADGALLQLLVRVAIEKNEDSIFGYVVTFDDTTELESAQRKAAWSDVARRIAHEIKNPLTPIQLSAERLKRKYMGQIKEDSEIFQTCTDTIIRHVEDIGRMVNEFSNFARMPSPVMARENLNALIEDALALPRAASQEIDYETDLPDEPLMMTCDRQQVHRVLTNLLLNASESIAARIAAEGKAATPGEIKLRLYEGTMGPCIEVIDNGRGLPSDQRDRLTDPYVTTRVGGTGLGLAIVKKIIEDHGGRFYLFDRDEGGAVARMLFPAEENSTSRGQDLPGAAQ